MAAWLRGLGWRCIQVVVWCANLVEGLILWSVKYSNPRRVGWGCIVVLTVTIPLAIGFNRTWVDRLTVIGFVVTVIGFFYTIYQLFHTRIIIEETQQAWARAAEEQSTEHYRFCLERTRTVLGLATMLANLKKWPQAADRAEDVSTYASHVGSIRPQANKRWETFSANFKTWSVIFRDGATNKPLGRDLTEWQELAHTLHAALDQELAPFTFYQGDT